MISLGTSGEYQERLEEEYSEELPTYKRCYPFFDEWERRGGRERGGERETEGERDRQTERRETEGKRERSLKVSWGRQRRHLRSYSGSPLIQNNTITVPIATYRMKDVLMEVRMVGYERREWRGCAWAVNAGKGEGFLRRGLDMQGGNECRWKEKEGERGGV